jgi:hypothetical protein
MGLGIVREYSSIRVPSPPQKKTTFTGPSFPVSDLWLSDTSQKAHTATGLSALLSWYATGEPTLPGKSLRRRLQPGAFQN